MRERAIASSGDPEKDQRDLERFERNDAAIQAGQCPNGCGELAQNAYEPRDWECIKCGFVYSKRIVSPAYFGG